MVEAHDPSVAVLVVHGIGTQSKGAELRAWLDAVVSFLRGGPNPLATSDIVPLDAEPGEPIDLHTPPLPAAHGARQRWRVGEAWWADAFPVPDRGRFTRWLVDIGPWFAYLFVVRLWRRFGVDPLAALLGIALAGSTGWLLRGAVRDAVSLGSFIPFGVTAVATAVAAWQRRERRAAAVVVAITYLVLLPIAGLATIGVVALWLVGMIPGKPGEKVRTFQLTLARSIGDVYALISDEACEQRMFRVLTDSARAIVDGAPERPLVIVAHSQGAALTYRAWNRHDPFCDLLATRDVTLITYGGAILPVHVLEGRLREQRPALAVLQGLAGLVGLLLTAFVFVRFATNAVDEWSAAAAAGAVALTNTVGVATWRQEKAQRKSVTSALHASTSRRRRWVDLWAPWDPVPNGPLDLDQPYWSAATPDDPLPFPDDGFFSVRVANHHQPWVDHVVYRAGHEDVVSRWVGEIAARSAGTSPSQLEQPPGADVTATARRVKRTRGVGLLASQAAIALGTIAALAARWRDLDDLGRWAARRVPVREAIDRGVEIVPAWLRDPILGPDRDTAHVQGLAVALGVVVLATAIGSVIVGASRSAATRAYLRHATEPPSWVAAGVTALLLPVAVGAAALVVAWPSVPLRPIDVHAAGVPGTTTVRFEPLGDNGEVAVEVRVDNGVGRVRLPHDTSYAVTATAEAGEDCAATLDDHQDVHVTCAPTTVVEATR